MSVIKTIVVSSVVWLISVSDLLAITIHLT